MCGIAGVLNKHQASPGLESVLTAMADKIKYRGPDDSGIYIDRPCGLTHRRLAIIDVTDKGRQPMSTADGDYTIAFNGEIYNFQELRKKYLSKKHLRSSSDTEVLLYLLATQGVRCLTKVRGMFALAMWERSKQRLLLARDPFGKKPLYYYHSKDLFVFASEIKSILSHPQVNKMADPPAVVNYLAREAVPGPKTGFAKIQQLPAGTYATVTTDGINITPWWRPKFTPKLFCSDDKVALRRLDSLLGQAVTRRLVADVPVGIFLSGGLDSTTVAWYMKRVYQRDIHSFAVSCREKSFDESFFAQMAAKAIGTVHHKIRFSYQDFIDLLPGLGQLVDLPLSVPTIVPTYAMSKMARQYIKVALVGEGSDELLAGYNTYRAAELSRWVPAATRPGWRLVERTLSMLPTRYSYSSLDHKIRTFVRGLSYPPAAQHQIWGGAFTPEELKGLLTEDYKQYIGQIDEDEAEPTDPANGLPLVDVISKADIHHYLPNRVLVKLDRGTMFASLEARAPFLDLDLVNFLTRLPIRLKRNKYLLRQLMRGRLPDRIIDRPKQGFPLPLGLWLRGPLYSWSRQVLSPDNVQRDGLVRPDAVSKIITEHHQGKADHHRKIWALLMLHQWYDRWIKDTC